ncbi:MAG: hypothetical protein F6K63_28670 [Moorea sp. SIO1G6]|uniref:hypothetical protein n=1 Tax=Moorena sp. SIO1G6 TaxID=2607840 RepID=UPI0013C0375B|nr:hypothetical protein [Moorena sp. SIO1G6]NET68150.1 hypothetical protein [Moorena sp. SIO1G6]
MVQFKIELIEHSPFSDFGFNASAERGTRNCTKDQVVSSAFTRQMLPRSLSPSRLSHGMAKGC